MSSTNINKRITKLFLSLCVLFGLTACIEEIELNTQNFESLIVVEANITNELKQQEVTISRTFRFEESGPTKVRNASVVVLANGSPIENFIETELGRYLSVNAFAAQEGIDYSLEIQTQDGKRYSSSSSQLPSTATINSMTAEASEDNFGNLGVSILANSSSDTGEGNFYRYEFTETYKIIAPFWRSDDLVSDPNSTCGVLIEPRQQEERICYNSENSTGIILAESIGQPQGQLNDIEVNFISTENTKIAHRYSILLKQHVISSQAFNYLKKRRDLSSVDNLFSQTQPGFLEGNIRSDEAPDEERVIGIFYVSTVSEKRFYFNWVDLYPQLSRPEIPCRISAPPLFTESGGCLLSLEVEANSRRYVGENLEPQQFEGPHLVVPRRCGDCTTRGSNIVPEFWEE